MKNKIYIKYLLLFGLIAVIVSFSSCKDDNKNGGDSSAPVIKAVYLEDAHSTVSDRKIDFARLGQTIRLEGESFVGVTKVSVNGYEIQFNPSYVTNTSMMFQISGKVPTIDAPDDVRNTIKLEKGSLSCVYDFDIRSAAPSITSISHTMPQAGDVITLYGSGLQEIASVTFPGGKEGTNILSDDEDGKWCQVTVPDIGNNSGSILVVGANGGAYSPACFNYKEGLLHNFDDVQNYSWGSGIDNTALTAVIPASTPMPNEPRSQGGYQCFNASGSLAANDVQKFWINSKNPGVLTAFGSIPASTSTDECGIQMDIYVDGAWNSGLIRFVVADGYDGSNSKYALLYQPVYPGGTAYDQSAFVNPGCWFTITLPFSLSDDFADKTLADVIAQVLDANAVKYAQIGPFFQNIGISDVFDPVAATEKIYFDNIRIVPLTTPAYSDFPDE